MTGTLLTDRGKEAIGDSKGQGGSTAAAALKIEDLLSIITNATISAQNYAPFWNQMNKRPAISNVVENTLLNDLGGVPGLGFLDPTTLTGGGADNDPDLARADQKMRWYGHDYSVQLPAALITAQGLNGAPAPGNVESTTSYAALNQLIIDLNYQAWHGNGTVNSLAANGFIQQVRAVHNLATGIIVRVNCGGKPLTQDHLSEAKAIMYANGSTPTDLWWSPNTLADVEKSLTPGQRYEPGKELDLLNIPRTSSR